MRSGDALVAFDEDLVVVAWNRAAEALTGISAEDALGARCWDVLGGVDTRGAVVCHAGCSDARLAREGWPVAGKELSIKTSAGRRRAHVATVSLRGLERPFYLHVLRNGEAVARAEEDGAKPVRNTRLTARQLEVLGLLAEGAPAKVIARRLGIAETTVRNHIRMILVELGAHSQLEALAEARRRRLIG
jgi:PAS domain S-box-containing protein